ncbi:MAG: mechanosensitive ion channel family protein [Solirubrobacteraceae bacterium]
MSTLLTPGVTFLSRHAHVLSAILTIALTLTAALLVDRWLARRAARGHLRPEIDTRVRFLRRFVALGIALLGVLFALSQFGGLNRLAAGVLASSAIIAAVVGFAARQTLANLVAGVMLTITQPLRIGDQVTIEDVSGVIEDVRLNYTILRTPEGRRVFIPNERLASGVLRNDTIIDAHVRPEVSLWLPLSADGVQAVEVIGGLTPGISVRIAEVTPEGVHIAASAPSVHVSERASHEAQLRLDALRALRTAGLLGETSSD